MYLLSPSFLVASLIIYKLTVKCTRICPIKRKPVVTQQVIKIIIYPISIYQGSVCTRHCEVEVEGQWRSSELEDGVPPSGSEIT